MGVRIEGLDRLRRKLGVLNDAERAAARTEVKRGALHIQAEAKRRAPVDTGRLRNSITHEERDDGLAAVIGTNVEYAPYQEFGTRFHAAQPFLLPAFELERPQFMRRLQRELERANREVSR